MGTTVFFGLFYAICHFSPIPDIGESNTSNTGVCVPLSDRQEDASYIVRKENQKQIGRISTNTNLSEKDSVWERGSPSQCKQ